MSDLRVPRPDLQIVFSRRLDELRATLLLDALLATVATADIAQIDAELQTVAPSTGLQRAAGWGLRGEIVFPVPCLLDVNPRLLGYYRLLLGSSQKEFYGKQFDVGAFKSMETSGRLSPTNKLKLPVLCQALGKSAAILVDASTRLTPERVHELTLLTLGPQLRGGTNNSLGAAATLEVFDLIRTLVSHAVHTASQRTIELKNAAGRDVKIAFANDPDISIREVLPSGGIHNLVAIEIKGGTDASNIHNRIGEAEKSHQKARQDGFVERWTVVGVEGMDLDLLRRESPSTDRFYILPQLRDATSPSRIDFREHLLARLGVADAPRGGR
ncbi:MAG: XcyI family restriction endonuclease [Ardenticatenales bacterium]